MRLVQSRGRRARAHAAASVYASDEPEFYDWYSAEEWLPLAVEAVAARVRAASGRAALDVLDSGCGVSPLLFSLAEAQPEGWRTLHGVDFAEEAVQFCAQQAALEGKHGGLRFSTGDARALDVPDASSDIVLDKGCLDCFVSGDGEEDVARYLRELSRVLRRPHGRVLILAVNGADVPHLLATGEIRPDGSCAGRKGAAVSGAAWAESKQQNGRTEPWEQLLWVEETVAYHEKHLLVLAPQQPQKAPQLRCHACGRVQARVVGPDMAEKCACGNKLRRFALS